MKKNGFMVVECIIASVVVLTAIIILYTQVKSVTRNYDRTFNYDNVNSMYALANFRTFLMNDDNYEKIVAKLNNNSSLTGCSKYYAYVTCDIFSSMNINYCDSLLSKMGITTNNSKPRQIIFTKANLKSNLLDESKCKLTSDSNSLNGTFIDYISTVKSDDSDKKYMLLAEFDDNTLASLVVYKGVEN